MKIVEAKTSDELKKYYDLRYEVLRKPWNQTYASTKDDVEETTSHYLMLEGDEAVATGRLQWNSDQEVQIRSMSVKSDKQGRGLGSIMVKHLETVALQKNIKHIILDAREN